MLAQFDSDDDEASNPTQQTDHRRHQGPLALETEQQQARCSESAEHPQTAALPPLNTTRCLLRLAAGERFDWRAALRQRGFVHHPAAVGRCLSADYAELFRSQTVAEGHIGRENRRKVRRIDPPLLGDVVAEIWQVLMVDGLLGRRVGRQPPVVLHSVKGCQKGPNHWDFDPMVVSGMADDDAPCSVVLALQDGTRFHLYPPGYSPDGAGMVVELDAGDLLVFRADMLHSGAAYDSDNYRVHFYLDHHDAQISQLCRQPNQTYVPRRVE